MVDGGTMNSFRIRLALVVGAILIISGCAETKTVQPIPISKNGDQYTLNSPLTGFSDFVLVETRGGEIAPRIVTLEAVIADLAKYDVVFAGEAHGHATNHYVQSRLFSGLHEKVDDIALSMEQFERSQQNIVDQYLASEIGEETLVFEGKAWPDYRSSYRALVEFAKDNSLPVIAAEVPANLVSCIAEQGPDFLQSLSDDARLLVAKELHLEESAYRDKFFAFMEAATGHSFSGDLSSQEIEQKKQHRYAAQVSRDDTMAESITKHIAANPGRKVFHITGSFHSASMLGTPERVLIRSPDLKLANVHPVLVKDPKHISFSVDDAKAGQYLLLLYPVPKRFVQMKNINAFIKRTQDRLDEDTCAY